jgi:hypothetical protein
MTNHYLPFFSVINPTIKLKWLEANWTADEVAAAKKWMLEAVSTTLFCTNDIMNYFQLMMVMPQMLEYQCSLRSVSTNTQASQDQAPMASGRRHIRASSASHGARAQLSGFACIKTIERSLSNPIIGSAPSMISSASSQVHETMLEDRAVAELAADQAIVDEQWKRYIDEGVIDDPDILEDFDLLFYWQVRMILHLLIVLMAYSIHSGKKIEAQAYLPCHNGHSPSSSISSPFRTCFFLK